MTRPCATCRREAQRAGNKFFPFCSARCQLIDLGRWLDEDYRIPDTEAVQAAADDDRDRA